MEIGTQASKTPRDSRGRRGLWLPRRALSPHLTPDPFLAEVYLLHRGLGALRRRRLCRLHALTARREDAPGRQGPSVLFPQTAEEEA